MRFLLAVSLLTIFAEGFVPNTGGNEKGLRIRENSTARFAVPIIDDWKILKDGSIKGTVTGHRNWKNGKIITTSPLKSPGQAGKDSVVSTTSGSRYRLAEPAVGAGMPSGGAALAGAAAFAAAAVSFFVTDSAGVQSLPVPFPSRSQENVKSTIDLKSVVKVPEESQARTMQENMLKATVAVEKADRIAEKMATTKQRLAAVAEAKNERLASVRVEPKLFSNSFEDRLKAEETKAVEATSIEVDNTHDGTTQTIAETAPMAPVMNDETTVTAPTIDGGVVQVGAAIVAAGGVAAAAVAAKPDSLKSQSSQSKQPASSEPVPVNPPSDELDVVLPIDIMMDADAAEASLVAESVGATPVTPWTPSSLTAEIDFHPPTDLDFSNSNVAVEEVVESSVDRLKTNLDLGLESARQWQQNELQSVMSKVEAAIAASPVPEPLEVVDPGAPTEPISRAEYGDEAFAHLVPATALFSSDVSSFAENSTDMATSTGSYLDSLSTVSSAPIIKSEVEETLHEDATVIGSDFGSVVEDVVEEDVRKQAVATATGSETEAASSTSTFVEDTIEELLEKESPTRFTTETVMSDDGSDGGNDLFSDDKSSTSFEGTIEEPPEGDFAATAVDESDLGIDLNPSSSDTSFVEDSIEEILEEETPAPFTTATSTNEVSDIDVDLRAKETESSPTWQESVPDTSIPASNGVKAVTADVPGGFFSSALTDDSVFVNTVTETQPSFKAELPASADVGTSSTSASPKESTTQPTTDSSLAEPSSPASSAIGVSELDVANFESFSVRRAKRMAERERRRQWHSNAMDSPDMLRPQMVSARPRPTQNPNRDISPVSEARPPLEVVDPGASAEASPESLYSDDGSKPMKPTTALYSSATAQQDPVSMTTKVDRLKVELKLADEWKSETGMNGFMPAPPTHNGYQPVADPLNDLPPAGGASPRMPEAPTISRPKFPTASGASLPLTEKMRRLKNELELSRKFLDGL